MRQTRANTSQDFPKEIVFSSDGRPFECSPLAATIFKSYLAGSNDVQIAQTIACRLGLNISEQTTKDLRIDLENRLNKTTLDQNIKRQGISVRKDIIGEQRLNSISSNFTLFYNPVIFLMFAVFCILAVLSHFMFHAWKFGSSTSLGLADTLAGYAGAFAILFFHEIGHAAALAKFGERARSLGIGIFIIFPFAYTDVTRAWSLDRWSRVVVDLGGLYFQLVATAIVLAIYDITHFGFLMISISISIASSIFALNPLLRNDGYWALCDLTGISDLKQRSYCSLLSVIKFKRGHRNIVACYAALDITFTAMIVVFFLISLTNNVTMHLRLGWFGFAAFCIIATGFSLWSFMSKIRKLFLSEVLN